MRSIMIPVGCLALLLAAGCGNQGESGSSEGSAPAGGGPAPTTGAKGADGKDLRVAVIPKGTTHAFWKSVETGAKAAGKELGVAIEWKGPLKENDRANQIGIVQQFASRNISGIVLAPLDDTALVSPVRSAMAKDIPVVIFDSPLKGEVGKDFVSLVATDNHKAGMLGGEQLATLLGNKGKVVLLRYQEGSASTAEREAGFLEVMKKNPGIQILVENRYAGATVDEAKSASMNLMSVIRQADGIFCPNESSTQGMLLALRQNNLAGKVKFVGFDATPPLVQALQKGDIQALVAQNPTKMGHEAVKTLVSKLRGESVSQRVDTGATVITQDNLNTPEVKTLLAGG